MAARALVHLQHNSVQCDAHMQLADNLQCQIRLQGQIKDQIELEAQESHDLSPPSHHVLVHVSHVAQCYRALVFQRIPRQEALQTPRQHHSGQSTPHKSHY